jgi:hypothetical protein
MKMNLPCTLAITLACLGSLSANASSSLQAHTLSHYTGRCLDLAHHTGTDTNCEVSAVVRVGDQLLFANDKPIQGHATSAICSITIEDLEGSTPLPLNFDNLTYARSTLIDAAQKLEGLTTLTLDDTHYAVASSAFTRAQNPAFNKILYWPVDNPAHTRQLGAVEAIREQISAIVGEPFFQVEGLAIGPANTLLLGIRQQGSDYTTAHPVFTIVQAPITVQADELVISGAFELAYQFEPRVQGDDRPLSLSSLEYDPFNKRLLATTSHEQGDQIGGYLWALPLSLLEPDSSGIPLPFLGPDGSPLWFDNKPEGVVALNARQVVVVHDDDRVQVADSAHGKAKQANEFTYSVIELGNP